MNKEELNTKTHDVINTAFHDAKFNNTHFSPASTVLRALKDNNLSIVSLEDNNVRVTVYEILKDGDKIGVVFGEKNKDIADKVTLFLNAESNLKPKDFIYANYPKIAEAIDNGYDMRLSDEQVLEIMTAYKLT